LFCIYGGISDTGYNCSSAFLPADEAKKKDANASPQIIDAFGADAIIQNSTRALSFTQIENGAKCTNLKNRYGQRGKDFLYVWNINYGVFKPLHQTDIKDNLF